MDWFQCFFILHKRLERLGDLWKGEGGGGGMRLALWWFENIWNTLPLPSPLVKLPSLPFALQSRPVTGESEIWRNCHSRGNVVAGWFHVWLAPLDKFPRQRHTGYANNTIVFCPVTGWWWSWTPYDQRVSSSPLNDGISILSYQILTASRMLVVNVAGGPPWLQTWHQRAHRFHLGQEAQFQLQPNWEICLWRGYEPQGVSQSTYKNQILYI